MAATRNSRKRQSLLSDPAIRPKVPVRRMGMTAFGLVMLLLAGAAVGQNASQSPAEQAGSPVADNTCARSVLFNFPVINRHGENVRDVPIWQIPGSDAFFFVAGMTIDADGSPNAYHPDNIGLDDIANAGEPGHWDGIITDENGDPLIQGPNDPFPGYYVSCTSLSDRTKGRGDPARYVDASKIPYVVLPRDVAQQGGAQLGDFAVVINLRNGKSSYAIFADVGTLGEGSISLADNLGIASNARWGGSRGRILYLVFPRSGNRQPRTIDEIYTETEKLFQNWGGAQRAASCTTDQGVAADAQPPAPKPVAAGDQASAPSN